MKTTMMFLAASLAACADEPPIDPAQCDAARIYQIDTVDLPLTSAGARDRAFDLDGDGVADNQLGSVSGYLTHEFSEVPLELGSHANAHLTTDTTWQIRIADCGDDRRLVAIGREDAELALPGYESDGVVDVTGAGGTMPLIALFDGTGTASPPTFAPSERTAVRVTETGDELTGTIGFAIDAKVAPVFVIHGMAPFLVEQGDPYSMDTDNNGTLTEAEIAANSLARAVLTPDVRIHGVDALSFAVTIHATRI